MTELQVTQINIAYPQAETLHLKFAVGGCRLRIKPAEVSETWVTGTYEAAAGTIPCKIETADGTVRISQDFSAEWWRAFGEPTPKFDLALGMARPYALTFEAGAIESRVDLGGLPITRLSVKQGAGSGQLDFSAPNPEAMSLFEIDSGAVGIELKRLANANFAEMRLSGGAASYELDFGGAAKGVQRDAQVRITAGMASVAITVPADTAAVITTETFLGSLDVGDGFMKKEGAFRTEAALADKGPILAIHANVTLGSLSIRTR